MRGESHDQLSLARTPDDLSRRSMLAKLGVGAGIVWVAPTVLSSPALAQGTCLTGSIDWADPGIEASLDSLETTPFDLPTGVASTVTLSFDNSNMGSGTGTVSSAGTTPLGGLADGFVELSLDTATGAGQYVELTFTFSSPVQGLTFNLLDIDLATGAWIDEVTLYASNGGTDVTLGLGDFTIDTPANVAHSTTVVPTAGDVFTGIADPADAQPGVDNTTTGGNVAISYPGSIDLLIVRYGTASTTDFATQQVGLSGFDFCAFG